MDIPFALASAKFDMRIKLFIKWYYCIDIKSTVHRGGNHAVYR